MPLSASPALTPGAKRTRGSQAGLNVRFAREGSHCLSAMGTATKKKIVSTLPLNSMWGSTENHIQCRLHKFLIRIPTPTLSFCSSCEVKQNVMYCILYDFERSTMSQRAGWERDGLQCYYISPYFYMQGWRRPSAFVQSVDSSWIFSSHSMWPPFFGATRKQVSSARGNWKGLVSRWRSRREVVNGNKMDDPVESLPTQWLRPSILNKWLMFQTWKNKKQKNKKKQPCWY